LRALSRTTHSMNLDHVPNISLVMIQIYALKCKPRLIIFDNLVPGSWFDMPIIHCTEYFWLPVVNCETFTCLTWLDLD